VIALSYGERGESGALWKAPDQMVENVKRIRHEQASEAAGIVGAALGWLDMGGYPLIRASEARSQRGARLREELLAGKMSYELHGLRKAVEKKWRDQGILNPTQRP
jgi:LmbE family N-acetylglucosaminyl deacetylase